MQVTFTTTPPLQGSVTGSAPQVKLLCLAATWCPGLCGVMNVCNWVVCVSVAHGFRVGWGAAQLRSTIRQAARLHIILNSACVEIQECTLHAQVLLWLQESNR